MKKTILLPIIPSPLISPTVTIREPNELHVILFLIENALLLFVDARFLYQDTALSLEDALTKSL